MSDPTEARMLYQCPGCWGYNIFRLGEPGGCIECECGERMTRIDLRAPEVYRIEEPAA